MEIEIEYSDRFENFAKMKLIVNSLKMKKFREFLPEDFIFSIIAQFTKIIMN